MGTLISSQESHSFSFKENQFHRRWAHEFQRQAVLRAASQHFCLGLCVMSWSCGPLQHECVGLRNAHLPSRFASASNAALQFERLYLECGGMALEQAGALFLKNHIFT